jgi:hypothetical protein
MEWQPIETAPMTRAPKLLGRCGNAVMVGRWYEDAVPPGWYSDNSGPDEFTAKSNPPTHWMPLPPPPVQS